jgi:hypothetical protein
MAGKKDRSKQATGQARAVLALEGRVLADVARDLGELSYRADEGLNGSELTNRANLIATLAGRIALAALEVRGAAERFAVAGAE